MYIHSEVMKWQLCYGIYDNLGICQLQNGIIERNAHTSSCFLDLVSILVVWCFPVVLVYLQDKKPFFVSYSEPIGKYKLVRPLLVVLSFYRSIPAAIHFQIPDVYKVITWVHTCSIAVISCPNSSLVIK